MAKKSNAVFETLLIVELQEVEGVLAEAGCDETGTHLMRPTVGEDGELRTPRMSSARLELLLRQKSRLQAALERVRTGHFGKCCDCGDEIPRERLAADIAAPFCAYCQEEIDDRRQAA